MYIFIYLNLRPQKFEMCILQEIKKTHFFLQTFPCQQRVLKTFPGPGYLRSEDRVV